MAKHSKAYRAAVEKIGDATYAPLEAFAMVKEVATTKFDQTIEAHFRLGIDTRVYLASAELSAIAALLGRLPTVAEYQEKVQAVNAKAADVYRYMNFDQIPAFVEVANTVEV